MTGHKWFTSAAMSDIFLVLAQAPGGLSCFMLPRVLPDGTRTPLAAAARRSPAAPTSPRMPTRPSLTAVVGFTAAEAEMCSRH
ncbi:hypothetical protein [Candidatus Mycolicibacterium alkanivorans]|uniref:Acyl-CoA oxidase/dehydrogenase middle domain-containing protein n=1 Tax=Candidatus Mycolicibacterium alkanivorans TaxID=2954114 RepID=A0ABS9Z1F9_9MYCO|nr:hypothetical protein [Candidatus Mycolicibacterium alkanivorans]MCI4677017.1 hypothetical protein [Candidatus Mycolicibacterium alkanivorans]